MAKDHNLSQVACEVIFFNVGSLLYLTYVLTNRLNCDCLGYQQSKRPTISESHIHLVLILSKIHKRNCSEI